MGMAVLVCHLSSQLHFKMAKEQILTSAGVSVLSDRSAPIPRAEHPFTLPSSPGLQSVLQAEGV